MIYYNLAAIFALLLVGSPKPASAGTLRSNAARRERKLLVRGDSTPHRSLTDSSSLPSSSAAATLPTSSKAQLGRRKLVAIGLNSCVDGTCDIGNKKMRNRCQGNIENLQGNVCSDSNSNTDGSIIGANACHGFWACHQNKGNIGDKSCVGKHACPYDTNYECRGDAPCDSNAGTIGTGSCYGHESCAFNSGTIEDGACIKAEGACASNSGTIGSGCCTESNYIDACNNNNKTISLDDIGGGCEVGN